MTYKEFKEKASQELNEFTSAYCVWAFGKEQLQEALKKLGLTQEQFEASYCGFFGGGAIRKDKVKEYVQLAKKQSDELKALMQDEKFAYDALYYELANHEYGYTYDETPALDALELTADQVVNDPVLNRAFCKASKEIKNSQY